jgi:hypothetical protein
MSIRHELIDLPYAFTFGYRTKRGAMKYVTCRRSIPAVVPHVEDVEVAFVMPGHAELPELLVREGAPLVPAACLDGCPVAGLEDFRSILERGTVGYGPHYPAFGHRQLSSLPDYDALGIVERVDGDEPVILDRMQDYAARLRSTPRGMFLVDALPVAFVHLSARDASIAVMDASVAENAKLLSDAGGRIAVPLETIDDLVGLLEGKGLQVHAPTGRILRPFRVERFFVDHLTDRVSTIAGASGSFGVQEGKARAHLASTVSRWAGGGMQASDVALAASEACRSCDDPMVALKLEILALFTASGMDAEARMEAIADTGPDDEVLASFRF